MANELKYILDTARENYSVNKCKQNDDRQLVLTLLDKGQAYNLVGATIKLKAKKSDGSWVIQTTDMVITNNIVTIQLVRDITRVAGRVNLELQITKTLKDISTFTFTLEVVPGVIQDGDLQSSNAISVIEELDNIISEANNVNNVLKEDILNGNTAAMRSEVNAIKDITIPAINVSIGLKASQASLNTTNINVTNNKNEFNTFKTNVESDLADIPSQTYITDKAKQSDLISTNENVANNYSTLDNKINAQASGSPKGTYGTLALLTTAYPTGDTGVYIVSADGKLYSWLNSAWTPGGVYQSTGVANNTIDNLKIVNKAIDYGKADFLTIGKNMFNKQNIITGKYMDTLGSISNNTLWFVSALMYCIGGSKLNCNIIATSTNFAFYDINSNFISGFTTSYNGSTTYAPVPSNAVSYKISCMTNYATSMQIEVGTVVTALELYNQKLSYVLPNRNSKYIAIYEGNLNINLVAKNIIVSYLYCEAQQVSIKY